MKRTLAVASLAALALAAVVLVAPAASSTTAATVKVKLVEFKVLPSPKTAPAGKVTFAVTNAGKVDHELKVLFTKTPAAKLPVKGAKAVETGRVGATKLLKPGQSQKITLTLKKGHYALICNVPGHYQAGQRIDFNVK